MSSVLQGRHKLCVLDKNSTVQDVTHVSLARAGERGLILLIVVVPYEEAVHRKRPLQAKPSKLDVFASLADLSLYGEMARENELVLIKPGVKLKLDVDLMDPVALLGLRAIRDAVRAQSADGLEIEVPDRQAAEDLLRTAAALSASGEQQQRRKSSIGPAFCPANTLKHAPTPGASGASGPAALSRPPVGPLSHAPLSQYGFGNGLAPSGAQRAGNVASAAPHAPRAVPERPAHSPAPLGASAHGDCRIVEPARPSAGLANPAGNRSGLGGQQVASRQLGGGWLNPGSLCYAIASLVCLFHAQGFVHELGAQLGAAGWSQPESALTPGSGTDAGAPGVSEHVLRLGRQYLLREKARQQRLQRLANGETEPQSAQTSLSALPLRHAVGRARAQFSQGSQQDAHEFLSALLELAHAELASRGAQGGQAGGERERRGEKGAQPLALASAERRPHAGEQLSAGLSAQRTRTLALSPHGCEERALLPPCEAQQAPQPLPPPASAPGNAAPACLAPLRVHGAGEEAETAVSRHFCTELVRKFECLHCGHSWMLAQPEVSAVLSLDMPQSSASQTAGPATAHTGAGGGLGAARGGATSLAELVAGYLRPYVLDCRCEACKSPQGQARVSPQLSRLPQSLVLHLKRFEIDQRTGKPRKRADRVQLEARLDLGPFCSRSTRVPRPRAASAAPAAQPPAKVSTGRQSEGLGPHAARKSLAFEPSQPQPQPRREAAAPPPVFTQPLAAPRTFGSRGHTLAASAMAGVPDLAEQRRARRAVETSRDESEMLRAIEASQLSFALERSLAASGGGAGVRGPREAAELTESIDLCSSTDEEEEAPALQLKPAAHRADKENSPALDGSSPPRVSPATAIECEQQLSISPPAASDSLVPRALYQLQAVVQHCGSSAQYGHYIAATRNAESGRWIHHDDLNVTRGGDDNILSDLRMQTQSYILVFSLMPS